MDDDAPEAGVPDAGTRFPKSEGPDGDEVATKLRRRVLWSMPTGLYLMGSRVGERCNLMTTSLAVQVSVRPCLVGVALEHGARTLELVEESGRFTLSLLHRRDRTLVRRFVKPVEDVELDADGAGTMNGEPVTAAPSGLPVPAVALAWLDCALTDRLAWESHTFVVGEVTAAGFGPQGEGGEVLRMEDTRMHYGG